MSTTGRARCAGRHATRERTQGLCCGVRRDIPYPNDRRTTADLRLRRGGRGRVPQGEGPHTRLREAFGPYSPNVVEGEFCEVSLRACADRLATFHTCRFSERFSGLFITH